MQFDFLQFPFAPLQFFNLVARGLFNCFARVLLNTLINYVFFVLIFLTIFLTPILFPLCNCTITIDGNVHNLFKNFSVLFWICFMSLRFVMKTINMFSHVRFMACISYNSGLYEYNISFILLMVVFCAVHVSSYVELNKCLQNSYIQT